MCNGTGYSGLNCGIRVVYFRPIPPVLDDELKFPITLYTDVVEFSKTVSVSIKVPNVLDLQMAVVRVVGGQIRSINVRGGIGVVKVTLPRTTDVIYKPRERDIYVTGGTINSGRQSYFEQFNLTRGLLRPSCCSADDHVTLSCPGDSTQKISLLSPCGWSIKPNDPIRTENGAVFVQSSRLTLPTSLSGLRYRGSRLNDIIVNPKKCNHAMNVTLVQTGIPVIITQHKIRLSFSKPEPWPTLTSPKFSHYFQIGCNCTLIYRHH